MPYVTSANAVPGDGSWNVDYALFSSLHSGNLMYFSNGMTVNMIVRTQVILFVV